MKNVLIGAALAVLAAGSAYAIEGANVRQPADADGNGVLSRAEAQASATQRFALLDANKDGKLDQADREARGVALFQRLDTDRNGQLSQAEFSARPAFAARAPGSDDKAKGDRGFRRGGHGRGHRGAHPGFADADNDGAVTQAEFTQAALRRFDAADANKDGNVTKEERQARRQHGRGDGHGKHDGHGTKPAAAPAT